MLSLGDRELWLDLIWKHSAIQQAGSRCIDKETDGEIKVGLST